MWKNYNWTLFVMASCLNVRSNSSGLIPITIDYLICLYMYEFDNLLYFLNRSLLYLHNNNGGGRLGIIDNRMFREEQTERTEEESKVKILDSCTTDRVPELYFLCSVV